MLNKYGVAAVLPKGHTNYSANCCLVSLPKKGFENWSFFALFEGHDGTFVSEHLSRELIKSILNTDQEFFDDLANSPPDLSRQEIEARMKKAIDKAMLDIDKNMSYLDEIKGLTESAKFPGSAAVACLISPTDIYLINCGDSKAILVSDNKVKSITKEHLVIISDEKTRIENAGGNFAPYVIYYKGYKSSVTRGFGDYHFKANLNKSQLEQMIIAQPDLYANERSASDEFVLLASKNVWSCFETESLKSFIHSRLKITNNLSKICQEIAYVFLKKVFQFDC